MWYLKKNDNAWSRVSYVLDFYGQYVRFIKEEDAIKALNCKNKYAPEHINYFCVKIEENELL